MDNWNCMGEINIIKSPHYNMPFTSPIGHKHFQHTFFSKPISLKGNTMKKSYPYKICYLPNKKNLESLKRERERSVMSMVWGIYIIFSCIFYQWNQLFINSAMILQQRNGDLLCMTIMWCDIHFLATDTSKYQHGKSREQSTESRHDDQNIADQNSLMRVFRPLLTLG